MTDNPDDTAEPDVAEDAASPFAQEWADEYESGAELFGATFDADDFDEFWGEPHPDGATIAVMRGRGKPPEGWILAHAHLSEIERLRAILDKHACPRALALMGQLKDEPLGEFIDEWGRDGGIIPGKSNRSARRSETKKRR